MFIIKKDSIDYSIILPLLAIRKINKVIKYKFSKLYKKEYSKLKIFLI